jgi:hypothetical protein
LEKEERIYHRLLPTKTKKLLPRGGVLAGGRPQFHYSNQPLPKAEGMGFFAQPLKLNLW